MILGCESNSLKIKGFDADRMRDILCGSELEHYLLKAWSCDVDHHRWTCGGVVIDSGFYSFPVRVVGSFSKDRICIGYLRRQTDRTRLNGVAMGPESIEICPGGADLDYRAGPGGHWVGVSVTEEKLQSVALRRVGREVKLPRNSIMHVTVPVILRAKLDHLIHAIMKLPELEEEMLESLLGNICELIHRHEIGMDSLEPQVLRRKWHLERADHFLRNTVGLPFDVKKLASYAGISPRSLQRQYGEVYGITPQKWARCLALHQVKSRLRQCDPGHFSIEGLARDSGFHHPGRFSQYYKELFGETPSITLQSQRSHGSA